MKVRELLKTESSRTPTQRSFNQNSLLNFLQIKEDPTTPGRYYGVDAPEFSTHASGQILRMDAPPAGPPHPLPPGVRLEDAGFWTPAQAALLRQQLLEDADWAGVVDQLNLALRAPRH